jgi:hypothetical protein
VNCEARISLSAAIKYTSNRSRGRPINSAMGEANNEQSLCYPAARGFIRVRLVPPVEFEQNGGAGQPRVGIVARARLPNYLSARTLTAFCPGSAR